MGAEIVGAAGVDEAGQVVSQIKKLKKRSLRSSEK